MSNKSVLGSPSVGVNPSRTSFPVSQSFTFTAAPGMLLPAYKKFLNIGDRISGVPSFFMRTEPMLAPSMTDIDCHLDIFFVPMRHMVGMFENWFTQVSDANSDLWTESTWTAQLPVMNGTNGPFGWVNQSIFNMAYPGQETFGFGMHRLVNMMGDNAQGMFTNLTHLDYSYQADQPKFDGIAERFWPIVGNNKSMAFCPYFYMAYQKIYMDVYRDTEFETNVVQSYNIDSLFNSGATTFHPNYPTDNRWQMFELRYRNRNKDYFTSVHVNPVFNANGFLNNALSNLSAVKNWLDGSATYGVTPDGNSVQWTDVLDATNPPLNFSGSTTDDRGKWSSSTAATTFGTSNGDLYYGGVVKNFIIGGSGDLSHTHNISVSASTQNLTNMTNISAMRVGFALDKLLRAQNRAGRHADDQLYALFGVKLPQGISNEVYHVKSYQTMVHLGEVVSTAQTEMSNGQITPIGEMAGRGVALLNSKESFSFTAPCHGVFMALFSVAPRYRYIGAVEKENYKVGIHDFFRIQTDNLGQQPSFGYEYGDTVATTRSAWQYYLMEDKIKFDKSSLAFTTNGNDPWTFSTVAPKYTMGHGFKVRPDDLNSLFVAQYDVKAGVWPDGQNNAAFYPQFPRAYIRDPFKVDFSMKCSLQSTMSRFGEPDLGGL